MSGVEIYEPPKQSGRGQLVDSLVILVLLMAVLFGVTYWVQSSGTAESVKAKPIAELPITAGEKAQYQKLVDEEVTDLQGVNDQVAAATPKKGSDQYPIELWKLLLTAAVIAGYLAFVYLVSFKEYREVIRERFGPPGTTTGTTGEVAP
jgi:hypothetical protein